MRRRNLLGVGALLDNIELPQGYTKLDYLATNGNAYIATGLRADGCYQCELKGFVPCRSNAETWFIGYWWSNSFVYLMGMYMNNLRCTCGRTSSPITCDIPSTDIFDDRPHIFRIMKDYIGIDDSVAEGTPDLEMFSAWRNVDFYLGKSYHTNNTGIIKKIYYCKFWNLDDNLVRCFIPCLDDNSIPCFYDTVTEETFYNAGTEGFTYENV